MEKIWARDMVGCMVSACNFVGIVSIVSREAT